jgi:hypothetical protein
MAAAGGGDDSEPVPFLAGHPLPIAVVATAVSLALAGFVFALPGYEREIPLAKAEPLPYRSVDYDVDAARDAFSRAGIRLTPRSHSPAITTLGNANNVVEVDVFGDPRAVEDAGFHDVTVDASGAYVRFARDCSAARVAEAWRGNVRVMVDCRQAGAAGRGWMRRARGALANLRG